MKTKIIHIPIYEIDLYFVSIDGPEDSDIVAPFLKRGGVEQKDIEERVEMIREDKFNGGATIYNFGQKKVTILLHRVTDHKTRIRILGHEKRHAEDRILNACGVDDIEAAGYLAGFLTEKLFSQI